LSQPRRDATATQSAGIEPRDPNDPLELLIVTAKLLTGFDVDYLGVFDDVAEGAGV